VIRPVTLNGGTKQAAEVDAIFYLFIEDFPPSLKPMSVSIAEVYFIASAATSFAEAVTRFYQEWSTLRRSGYPPDVRVN